MTDTIAPDSNSRKFGPIRMTPGVSVFNMLTYYFATVTSLLMFTFLPQIQPFLLADILAIPESQQGVLSGNLSLFGEIIILFSIGTWGIVSDKLGRKFVSASGFLIMGIALFFYPSVTSVTQLFMFRGLFAVGSSAITTMLATVIADYALDEDRGKASGLLGIGNGIGAILTVFVALQLPKIFMTGGATAHLAAQQTFWLIGGIAIVSAILMAIGLQGRTKVQKEQKKSMIEITKEGIFAAKDPGVALAYMAAFVSRGDLAIVGTFFTLWVVTYGTTEGGLSAADALASGGIIIGISQMAALVFAPVFGIMADRMDRVTMVIIAVSLSAIGYGSTIFVTDPTQGFIFVSAILIGIGEISGVIASGVLIAQQAPHDIRGSVIGIFSLCGGIGIMVATGVGGLLFDNWKPQGPFVLFAVFSVIVAIIGIMLKDKIEPRNEKIEPASSH